MKLLHLHSSFHAGGKELRAAKLINAFGPGVEHAVVSAQPGAFGAAAAIDGRMAVSYPDDFPALAGKPLPGRLQRLAAAMRGHDLVLTYNWGAMDAVMAHTLFGDFMKLPPLVHHEDGFNEDEAGKLKRSRNWYRRIALGRAAALVLFSGKVSPSAEITARTQALDDGGTRYTRRRRPSAGKVTVSSPRGPSSVSTLSRAWRAGPWLCTTTATLCSGGRPTPALALTLTTAASGPPSPTICPATPSGAGPSLSTIGR